MDLTLWSLLPAVLIACIALAESLAPRQQVAGSLLVRWINNAALYLCCLMLGAWLASWLTPAREVVAAATSITLPAFVTWAGGFVLLDLVLYGSHRLHHSVSLLWRFHAVHHSDPTVDLSTAVRHHPGEFAVNMGAGSLVAGVLAIPIEVMVAYGIAALCLQLWQHANVISSDTANRWLQLVIVTPDLHRMHHSRLAVEGNMNFGVVLTIWDRLFGTLLRPADGPARFGLDAFDTPKFQWLPWLLLTPLLKAEFSRLEGVSSTHRMSGPEAR